MEWCSKNQFFYMIEISCKESIYSKLFCYRMTGIPQTQLAQSMQPGGGQNNTLTSQVTNQPSPPMVVPVFPIRPAPPPSSSHYSPYSPSRFHIDKRCQYRCSWKCSSILLIFLSVLLTGMLTYFAGKCITI